MYAYVIRRLLFGLVILFLASITIFWLVSLSGNPLTQLKLSNPRISPQDLQRISHQYGLDKPLVVQYLIWIRDIVLHGNFGLSFKQNTSVNNIIIPRIWPTVLLLGSALVVSALIGIPFGIYSAIRRYSTFDKVGTFFTFVGYSMPDFWLGLILQLLLGVYLAKWAGTHIFAISGIHSPGQSGFIDLLQHLALPVITLSVIQIANYSRFQRSAMLDVLDSDYLRTARAKGLRARSVYLKHALRNALIPTVTILALNIAYIAGGAPIAETIFSWPGLGFLLVDSIYKGDYNVARALLLIFAVLVVLFNLIADIVYAVVDPRVSYS
ncbi:MAG: ABC transporter permease [Rubrobacteraceae bacterium]|uniref:ABC transporter permease n=1 Tax=Rubrobacter naiadicus TaxID=1392641 RepID=UPI00235FB3BB|nr:ABC transporter permease [Rubrobacter naiadicus]MBX6763985.1 ABC transporter permease [Rubrobacteraceae bacterium]